MSTSLTDFMRRYFVKISASLIIVFYLFNGIQYIRSQSITSDEHSFFDYAKRYATGHPQRIYPETDNSKMPVSVLNILPRAVEQLMHPGLKKKDWGTGDIVMGRYVTLFISLLTLLLVFRWASELYGPTAGLFALLLMSFCPNNLANAGLVTTDSYSALFLLAAMYFLWKFCTCKTAKYFILFCVTVAISQLVKQSLFHLYILAPVCLCIYYVVRRSPLNGKLLVKYAAGFILINWFIINLGYYFYGSNSSLGSFHFMSHLFTSLQHGLPSALPLPLPTPFVTGLDMAKYYDQIGGGYDKLSSFGKVTILGEASTGGSFWYYYLVSILYKTPISYFIFLGYAVYIMVRYRSLKDLVGNELFLILPVLYFLTLMSLFYKTQCGLRQMIFIYPLLFVLCAGIIPYCKNSFRKGMIAALGIFLIFSVARYWRNYYPYSNEFISDKKMAYAYIGASNLEFLQGRYFAEAYLAKHPEVRMAPSKPMNGIFLINTDDYLDIWNRHVYDWITKYRPSGQVAYSWLIITVEAN